MGYTVWERDMDYGPRKGLEGPFTYPNGRTLYYDTKEGEYWDPRTDFYVPHDEISLLNKQIFDIIKR